ncbi:MAG: efflux RND transporter periplasmic adaptor subunit [Streptosporangiales bacterium]|nr:efflux RND transporter periplasmic adaptor subunit [Streptosporangiales bacterium]
MRPRTVVLSVAGAAVLGTAGVAAAGLGGAEPVTPRPTTSLETAAVERTTLVDSRSLDGTLGYGDPSTAASGGGGGILTWVAAPGASIFRGEAVYKVDDAPVPLLYGSLPIYRTLASGSEGEDVEQLERNLRALGYTGFTVDETYDAYTAAAVERWQDDLGAEETGRIAPGSAVVASGAIRVAERKASKGERTGGPVLTYTGTTRVVTVDLEVQYQQMAKEGATVTVELPDDSTTKGTITDVGKVAEETGEREEQTTTIEVTIAVKKQKSLGSYDKAPVEVTFAADRRKDVLAVPIAALLAQADGGYAVQVVSGGSTRTVPVETGLFTEGKVEVTGAGLAEGMKVGVPS